MLRERKSSIVRVTAVVMVALLGLALAVPGTAEERRDRREREEERHEVERWGRGDIRRFHERDLARWRGGHWFHGVHFGRVGWWWVVDGAWYFYPAAVYPYPDPYVPPTVVGQAPPPAPGQSAPQY